MDPWDHRASYRAIAKMKMMMAMVVVELIRWRMVAVVVEYVAVMMVAVVAIPFVDVGVLDQQ